MTCFFWQRTSAYFLLALFLTPLATTEWHDITFAKNSLKPWVACHTTDELHFCDHEGHEAHHCAICEFSIAQTILPDESPLILFPKSTSPHTQPTYFTALHTIPGRMLKGRGPPTVRIDLLVHTI